MEWDAGRYRDYPYVNGRYLRTERRRMIIELLAIFPRVIKNRGFFLF